ncbi:hypothetical protein BDZ89DRAFT_1194510 [Hymenopellis radicata]|nr:hypothetical protein BDZ89DRAFT_1194510 [Hymenopellis radicata]
MTSIRQTGRRPWRWRLAVLVYRNNALDGYCNRVRGASRVKEVKVTKKLLQDSAYLAKIFAGNEVRRSDMRVGTYFLLLAVGYQCHIVVQATFRKVLRFLRSESRFLLTVEAEKRRTFSYVGQLQHIRFISRRNRMRGAMAVAAGV